MKYTLNYLYLDYSMSYLTFGPEKDYYKYVLLVKESLLNSLNLRNTYIDHFNSQGIDVNDVVVIGLPYDKKKVSAACAREFIKTELVDALVHVKADSVIVTDSEYFKYLTGAKKPDKEYGNVHTLMELPNIPSVYLPNPGLLIFKPELVDKVPLSLKALQDYHSGTYQPVGTELLVNPRYPVTANEFIDALKEYIDEPMLSCDVEAFSLQFWKAGIGSIGFAKNSSEGFAALVDYKPTAPYGDANQFHGIQVDNKPFKGIIKDFLEAYVSRGGKLLFHNSSYDVKVIIYELWMKHATDWEGMLEGIETLAPAIEDSKLVSYLALNKAGKNELSLKVLAQEFAGNYGQSAEDITDIRRIPSQSLLEYNLVDCVSTHYVYSKHLPTMHADLQAEIYETIFMPSVKLFLQVELVGVPINMDTVMQAQVKLEVIRQDNIKVIANNPKLRKYLEIKKREVVDSKNATWVNKRITLEEHPDLEFNPASPKQLQDLIYNYLHFPILSTTKSKQPSTDADTIKGHYQRTNNAEVKELLNAILELAQVSKILDTFIKAFIENSFQKNDGHYYLHGSFNIGGTVSGRLSSSNPNLQTMPSSGSKYAKIIKECFQPPEGWVMVAADFASLEDRISALTTKDPQKVKVYTDGYDGHCLRAHSYFAERMAGIDPNSIESINSIADLYPDERQDSKAPTFALTYDGTWLTLVKNCGFTPELAKDIEEKYHKLYWVSDEWKNKILDQAQIDGYVTVAFGLRVRTPLLAKGVLGTRKTPKEVLGERRTAGNALGQSYCMLNNRAGIELQERTLKSKHRLDILPIMHIHDAQYFIIKEDIETLKWLNDNLVDCMEWQELPEIQHDRVKLGGEVDIHYPTWANKVTIPNYISEDEIIKVINKPKDKS